MRASRAVLVLAMLALACRGPRPTGDPSRCAHLQSVREVRGLSVCEDVWSCDRPPFGTADRVGLRRVALCEGVPGPVVLYLPGSHMNAELPNTDPRYDLRLYLAQAGLRAWGLDYRTHAVGPDAPPQDLATLASWTNRVFEDDAAWATGFVRASDPGPVYLAGFSFGAELAYRVVARGGPPVAGLVILDGAAGGGRAPGGDSPVIDVASGRLPWPARQRLLQTVIASPRNPSPLPGFATAGDALATVLYNAPSFGGHGGLSAARDGVSDIDVVARLLASYDRWWPRAAFDPNPPKARGTLPVLAFSSTNMGPGWIARVKASAEAFGGQAASVRELPGYGHIDVLVARNAARQVFEPVRAWLTGRQAQ